MVGQTQTPRNVSFGAWESCNQEEANAKTGSNKRCRCGGPGSRVSSCGRSRVGWVGVAGVIGVVVVAVVA